MTEEQATYTATELPVAEQIMELRRRVADVERALYRINLAAPTTGSGVIDAAIALSAVVDVVRNNDVSAGLLGLLYDADDRFRRALAATDRELGRALPVEDCECEELWRLSRAYVDAWDNSRPLTAGRNLRTYIREHS